MRKFNLLVLLMLAGMFSSLQAFVPEAGKPYNIIQANGGLFVTNEFATIEGAGNDYINYAVTKDASGEADQIFYFIPVDGEVGTYYFQLASNEWYLFRPSKVAHEWGTGWVEDPGIILDIVTGKDAPWASTLDDAKFQFINETEGKVEIKCVGNGKIWGMDTGDKDGPRIYSNKDSNNPYHLWIIQEATEGANKDVLKITIDKAKALLETTKAGTGPDEYPAEDREALENILEDAEYEYENGEVQVFINEAVHDLNSAMDAYIDAVHPFLPDPSKIYNVIHSSGFFLGIDSVATQNIKIYNVSYDENQQFKFIPAEETPGAFYMQLVSTGKNFCRDHADGWGSNWWNEAVNIDPLLAQFYIKRTADGLYRLKTVAASARGDGYIGTDGNNANDGVYSDKNGKDPKHHWNIKLLPEGAQKEALVAALALAENLFAITTGGTDPDQYPADARNALEQSIATAKDIISNSNVQSEVNEATADLNLVMKNYRLSVNPYVFDSEKNYYIIHSSGKFLASYSASETNLPYMRFQIETTLDETTDNQKFKFEVVDQTSGIYNIKHVGSDEYFSRFELSGDGGSDWHSTLTTDPEDQNAQFIVTLVPPTDHRIKVVKINGFVGTDANTDLASVYTNKGGDTSNHYWRFVDVEKLGTKQINATNALIVTTANNELTIRNLEGNNVVALYTVTGQQVAAYKTAGAQFTAPINSGIYILSVKGDSNYGKVIVVK